ncbi:MAG: hypothetical protein WCX95_05090 [Candidatus Gracilibacteria bacterium]
MNKEEGDVSIAVKEKDRELSITLDSLTNQVNSLEDKFIRLSGRLSPILPSKPEDDENGGSEDFPLPETKFAREMIDQIIRLRKLEKYIVRITSDLAI